MRRTGCFLVGFLAAGLATTAMLAPLEARPRFGPRAVFGILGAPFGMFRRVIRPRVHRPHAYSNASRTRAVTEAVRRRGRGASALAGLVSAVWAGSQFWPSGFGDAVAYAAGESDATARFWSGGFADALAALVTPETKLESRRRGVADAGVAADGKTAGGKTAGDKSADREAAGGEAAAETTGAAPTPRPAACMDAGADAVAALARRLDERLAPKPDQEAAFAAFRQSLATAREDLRDPCPQSAADAAATGMPARLAAMRERLWAIQSAALALRGPFADLYGVLDDTQKKALDSAAASTLTAATDTAQAARRGDMPVVAAQICHMQAQAASARTAARIRAAVAPTPEQEAPFRTLTETSAGMAKLAVASCPAEPPATALARFDAVLSRLDAMLYAIVVVTTPLDVFYGSLSDDQKARFDGLGGRAES
jgi:hypothetical protein